MLLLSVCVCLCELIGCYYSPLMCVCIESAHYYVKWHWNELLGAIYVFMRREKEAREGERTWGCRECERVTDKDKQTIKVLYVRGVNLWCNVWLITVMTQYSHKMAADDHVNISFLSKDCHYEQEMYSNVLFYLQSLNKSLKIHQSDRMVNRL